MWFSVVRWFGGAVARGSQWQSGWIWVVQTPDGRQDRPEVCRWSNILSVVSDLKGDSFKPGKLLILHSDSRRWENSNVENAQQEKGGNNGMETWSELNEMEYIHMYIHLHMCVSFKWKKKKKLFEANCFFHYATNSILIWNNTWKWKIMDIYPASVSYLPMIYYCHDWN